MLTVGAVANMPDKDRTDWVPERGSEEDPQALMDASGGDVDLMIDNPDFGVMEQLVAYERGILALYKDYDQCPFRMGRYLLPKTPAMVACGRMTSASWGTLRPVW